MGLSSEAIWSLAIDPQTPTTLYTGTFYNGVYKSTDGGKTWNLFNDGLPGSRYPTLSIDPQTPTIIYSGDYQGNGKLYSIGSGFSIYLPLVIR